MTINVCSKNPKVAKKRLAKLFNVDARQTMLKITTNKDESLFIKFVHYEDVAFVVGGITIIWEKGFSVGEVQELANRIVKMFYKIREPESWAMKDSIKIKNIYLHREDMIIG